MFYCSVWCDQRQMLYLPFKELCIGVSKGKSVEALFGQTVATL